MGTHYEDIPWDDYAEQDYYDKMREEMKQDEELEEYFFEKFQKTGTTTEGKNVVYFQALFSTKEWNKVIESCIFSACERYKEDFGIDDEQKGLLCLSHHHYIEREQGEGCFVGFQIDFLSYPQSYEYVLEALQEHEDCKWVWKFTDFEVERRNADLHIKISRLEMRLREVLGYILWVTYEDKDNLLRDYKISSAAKKEGGGLPTDANKRNEELNKRMENELFYVSFPAYREFQTEKLRKVEYSEVFAALRNTDDFVAWRNEILNKGIQEERYEDFIASLSENMENIDIVRNCIAHARHISDEQINSFEKAYSHVEKSIEEFWMRETEENAQ